MYVCVCACVTSVGRLKYYILIYFCFVFFSSEKKNDWQTKETKHLIAPGHLFFFFWLTSSRVRETGVCVCRERKRRKRLKMCIYTSGSVPSSPRMFSISTRFFYLLWWRQCVIHTHTPHRTKMKIGNFSVVFSAGKRTKHAILFLVLKMPFSFHFSSNIFTFFTRDKKSYGQSVFLYLPDNRSVSFAVVCVSAPVVRY